MDTFNVFILFPKEILSEAISDQDSYNTYLNQIRDLINRTDCEKGATLFYDNSEYQEFANALDELAYAGEFYFIKPRRVLNALLKNAIDWTENSPKQLSNSLYILWDFDSCHIVSDIPPSVKEAFEYQITAKNDEKCTLLNIRNDFYPHKKALFIFKDSSTYTDSQMPVFAKIDQVSNFEDVEQWFKNNRTLRQLNTIDQRHNEQSRDYIRGKSPLLYDLSRGVEATLRVQNLLNDAISDQYESKDLMNYDSEKHRYIWFEYENDNPQNQYHAYHLAKPISYETDNVAISKIPERAKRFIDSKNKKEKK